MLPTLADLMVNSYPTSIRLQVDPTRVLEAVVGGVTFLGAGTIIAVLILANRMGPIAAPTPTDA